MEKNSIKVLLPCSNFHAYGMISALKNNYENREVQVFCTNCNEYDLPTKDICDGGFLMPKVTESDYIEKLLVLCKENHIGIIMPISNIDLNLMAANKKMFAENGIFVSTTDADGLVIANDKINLWKRYNRFMPKQVVNSESSDVEVFLSAHKCVCLKLTDFCGGRGFAVVDDEKANNPFYFHRFAQKHYITKGQLRSILSDGSNKVILQEYIGGLDYTVSCLCYKGEVTHIVGYVGYMLEFGSIMYGEIKPNDEAYEIARYIVSDLKLDGNIAFDFILKDDGGVVLLEVNPRANASLPFVAKAGCNMLYLRCKQLLGLPYKDEQQTINVGLKMKKYFDTKYF